MLDTKICRKVYLNEIEITLFKNIKKYIIVNNIKILLIEFLFLSRQCLRNLGFLTKKVETIIYLEKYFTNKIFNLFQVVRKYFSGFTYVVLTGV